MMKLVRYFAKRMGSPLPRQESLLKARPELLELLSLIHKGYDTENKLLWEINDPAALLATNINILKKLDLIEETDGLFFLTVSGYWIRLRLIKK